jgi:very-short-patch-repair endonuclease
VLQPGDIALLDALDRHARRRTEGIATLSVLVGPFERAVELWAGWSRRRGLRVLLAQGEDAHAVVSSWAAALVGGRDLQADAEALVARALPPSHSHEPLLRNKTAHERRVLLERLPSPGIPQAAWELCRRLLEAPVPPAPGHPPDAVREAISRDPVEALHALLELVPGDGAPALRVRMGPSLLPGLRVTASLCSAAPSLTVACALTLEAFEDCMRQGGSRLRAMMQEGRLDVEAPSVDRRKLARERKRARSRHEAFLYEQLCYHASTAGLFTLNEVVDLGDGSGPREVDLLCRELRLAVEIDGYFHSRAPDAYRSDQRKNVALQCAGYLVVRYLAEDVEARPEEILSELDILIAARRRGVVGLEEPNGHR